ncbi:N-acetylmuramoyl-L-alanine amidase [Streptococcus catagoni]|uniref:N-acetylmuramoyl-L-alanine amidase n=1 Tax=Streptococcus catagoni TaxID=2654874 RepID=UPI001407AA28|nr:N-acetylmuramoyl-L-alanine amidase [Streptococcus catagoni]
MKKSYKSKKFYLLAGFTLANLMAVGLVQAEEKTSDQSKLQTLNQADYSSPSKAVASNPLSVQFDQTGSLSSSGQANVIVDKTTQQSSSETTLKSSQEQPVSQSPKAKEEVVVVKSSTSSGSIANASLSKQSASVADRPEPNISYASHVKDIGWQAPVKEGQISGTSGQSKRVEAIQISLDAPYESDIEYASHVAGLGWQPTVSAGQISGTTGKSRAIEAIQINLKGELALYYDIYYRTHIASYGWLGWAKNGASAGSQGLSKQLEAYEIQLVKKGDLVSFDTNNSFLIFTKPKLTYQAHVQKDGWQNFVTEGQRAGTTAESKRIEAFKVFLGSTRFGDIQYQSHVQDIGWQDYVSSGQISGTTGQSRRVEAVRLRLTGYLAQRYSIKYRVHVQDIGWQDWVYDNYFAGTTGKGKRIEAIEIQMVTKVAKPRGLSASQGNYGVVNRVIYLDAGHGGYDSGASYFNQDEKVLNLQMQNLVKAKLETAGYTVLTTRTSDTYVDLIPRSEKANQSLSDLFISLHFNAAPNDSANGIETYYYQYYEEYPSAINQDYHNDAERLARSSYLAEAIQAATVLNTKAKNNGVLRNTFAVLRETTAPAVLLELGYMSNQAEFQKINTAAYQEKLAQGIVSGILSYYKAYTI